jgi:3-oxoacid CoA-transferase
VPQGTLAERLRAHAAGIPAFFTPTGASTAIEDGAIPQRYNEGGAEKGVAIEGIRKEAREFNGKRYILEPALAGDVALIRAWKVDEAGNCVFRCLTCLTSWSENVNSHRRFFPDTQPRTSAPSWPRMRN